MMTKSKRRILVTGADGFIGSHLTEHLLKTGSAVRALAQYNSFNSWGWLEEITRNKDLEVVSGDIRDPNFCRRITDGIDVVYHLAALIAIPYSYISPDSYIETNVRGTLNLCQASFENKVTKFIQTSTSEVYGTAKYIPIDEKHPKQPQSPYSASKIAADSIALSYYYSYGLPVIIARPFNTYGPRQSARAFIPNVIIQILNGNKTIKTGDLRPTRDMNYVNDTCRGLASLSEHSDTIGKEINICSNSEISMSELSQKICSILNVRVDFVLDNERVRPVKSEVFRLYGDNTLLKEITGYQPEFNIDEGLKLTCQWFSKNINYLKYKADVYNI